MAKKRKNELKLARKGKTVRLTVEGVIGWSYFGKNAKDFRQELKDLVKDADTVELEINSPGGVITEGVAMANMLLDEGITVNTYVSGIAASMGSVLLMTGNQMFIPSNTMVMVHKPLNAVLGNADDMRKTADVLDKFEDILVNMYMRHFKGTKDEMKALMSKETWLTADDMEEKFNNVTIMKNELQAVACIEPIAMLEPKDDDDEEDNEGFVSKFLNFLRGEGVDLGLEPKQTVAKTMHKEEEMTPEQLAELQAKITEGVMASLTKAGVVKAETAKETTEVEVPFEGDQSNPDDVKAHADKLVQAKQLASVNWNDPKSVIAYHQAISKVAPKKESNADTSPSADQSMAKKKQDQEDTHAFMAKYLPTCGGN